MATLIELNGLVDDPNLSAKVGGALLAAAKDVLFEDAGTANHANRLKWAKAVINDPAGQRVRMMRLVVGINSASDLATINALTDQNIKDGVALGINLFADGA